MCLDTSVNGLVGIDKTPPVQGADGHHTSASEATLVFALVDDRKHHQCRLQMMTTLSVSYKDQR